MPALAQTKPWMVSLMMRSPATAQDPHRLLLDEGLVGERVVGVDGHQAVLGLRHDLLGDDDDVAVGEAGVVAVPGGVGDHARPGRCRR